MTYKYIVFRSLDKHGKKCYIFGTFASNNDVLPILTFYNIAELRTYLQQYNKQEVLILLKGYK